MIFIIWENLSARLSFQSQTKRKPVPCLSLSFSSPGLTCLFVWSWEWEVQDWFPLCERGPARMLERDFLQGHGVIAQGLMALNWKRVDLNSV